MLYFAKVRENAVIPSKRSEDAGRDCFVSFKDNNHIIIKPMETKLLPLGIASAFPKKYYFQLEERSSTGVLGIAQRAGVIDSGYRGEWHAPVTNLSGTPIIIVNNEADIPSGSMEEYVESLKETYIVMRQENAICQAIIIEVPRLSQVEIEYEDLMTIGSVRGTDGFGSTDVVRENVIY